MFYHATGGEYWEDNSNWLDGDPCINHWHGVKCALEDAPDSELFDAHHLCAPDPSTVAPGRCVVVGLELIANNMSGSLVGEHLVTLSSLKSLILRGNPHLKGALPGELVQMESLRELDLTDNRFSYSRTDILQKRLAIKCELSLGRGGLNCAGLPPLSCLAFGDQHVVQSDDSRQCVRCAGQAIAVAANSGLLVLFLAALFAYLRMIARNPDALTKWVSTASIVLSHLQTLTIVARLSLQVSFPVAGLGFAAVKEGALSVWIAWRVN